MRTVGTRDDDAFNVMRSREAAGITEPRERLFLLLDRSAVGLEHARQLIDEARETLGLPVSGLSRRNPSLTGHPPAAVQGAPSGQRGSRRGQTHRSAARKRRVR